MKTCVNLLKWNYLNWKTKNRSLEKELTRLLIPKDPQDDKNAVLEIGAGTGGDEASLFAGDILDMYLRYCLKKGWKTAIVSESEGRSIFVVYSSSYVLLDGESELFPGWRQRTDWDWCTGTSSRATSC